jgi:phenylacetate-coenzyme A ligase PaaK-like adenylate-forming protein
MDVAREHKKKLSSKDLETIEKCVNFTNEVLDKYSELLQPEGIKPELFLEIVLALPAMIAADIIERLARMYDKPEEDIYQLFRIKLLKIL